MGADKRHCDGCFMECEPVLWRNGKEYWPCTKAEREFAREWRGATALGAIVEEKATSDKR